jgi:hypothetical protein
MPPPNLQSIDSSFQLAEYLALLIKRDPRDVEGIVDLPVSEVSAGASASGSGASPEKTKDKEKDGQGERQGAGVGVGSKSGDNVGSPNGSGNSSGRKKEVDLVSPLLNFPKCTFRKSLSPSLFLPRLGVFRVDAFPDLPVPILSSLPLRSGKLEVLP